MLLLTPLLLPARCCCAASRRCGGPTGLAGSACGKEETTNQALASTQQAWPAAIPELRLHHGSRQVHLLGRRWRRAGPPQLGRLLARPIARSRAGGRHAGQPRGAGGPDKRLQGAGAGGGGWRAGAGLLAAAACLQAVEQHDPPAPAHREGRLGAAQPTWLLGRVGETGGLPGGWEGCRELACGACKADSEANAGRRHHSAGSGGGRGAAGL